MAKFDGIKGYTLLKVERSPQEVALVFRDNRYMFVSTEQGSIIVEGDNAEGSDVESVVEGEGRVEVRFRDGKKLVFRSTSGTLSAESIPE